MNEDETENEIADAIRSLLYGLKYSRAEGVSIAEAIQMAGDSIGSAICDLAEAIREHARREDP